jgi:hypothetical protein
LVDGVYLVDKVYQVYLVDGRFAALIRLIAILLDIFVGMAQMYPGTPFRVDITGANTGTEFRTTKMSSSMVNCRFTALIRLIKY